MARYYEKTALIEFVKKYTPTINGETTMKCVSRAIREAPTADVVPKSEVEELKADLEVWKQNRFNIFQMLELYKMTRQEAAREIFEEINSLRDEYSQGDIEYPDFQFRLGKIEKNYTEGE